MKNCSGQTRALPEQRKSDMCFHESKLKCDTIGFVDKLIKRKDMKSRIMNIKNMCFKQFQM